MVVDYSNHNFYYRDLVDFDGPFNLDMMGTFCYCVVLKIHTGFVLLLYVFEVYYMIFDIEILFPVIFQWLVYPRFAVHRGSLVIMLALLRN